MAVIQTQGSGPFGGWGGAATLVGTLTGQPWLTAIGTGMNAADSIATGGRRGSSGSNGLDGKLFDDAIEQLKGWINPAIGNIAKPGDGSQVLKYLREGMAGA